VAGGCVGGGAAIGWGGGGAVVVVVVVLFVVVVLVEVLVVVVGTGFVSSLPLHAPRLIINTKSSRRLLAGAFGLALCHPIARDSMYLFVLRTGHAHQPLTAHPAGHGRAQNGILEGAGRCQ
jgi:hypothetical protein